MFFLVHVTTSFFFSYSLFLKLLIALSPCCLLSFSVVSTVSLCTTYLVQLATKSGPSTIQQTAWGSITIPMESFAGLQCSTSAETVSKLSTFLFKLFANCCVSHTARWGRCQEGYGEDPHLQGELGFQYVTGLQNSPYSTYTQAIVSDSIY